MKLCVSDGFTFKYWFNVPDKMTVIEFHPILASYYGLKSYSDLKYLRLSIVPPTSTSNPWEMNLGDVKKNYLKKTDRFCDLPTSLINDQMVPLILVTGDTGKALSQEKSPPQSQTPSEHYDPHVPKDIEDYELFTPSILIYALALRATNREMIKVKSVLKEKLDLKSSVTLDVENSYGISSALSVSDFLQFIKTIFPLVNTTELKSHWSLNKPFVTVDDLDRILKICIFPTTHISFMTALHTAFELLDIPLTKSYPITGALRSQYVLETLEPLLKLMLEFAIRTAIDGGYLGVNAGFLPKEDSEKVLKSLGSGGFLCRLSDTKTAVSYIHSFIERPLPEPFESIGIVRQSSAIRATQEATSPCQHEFFTFNAAGSGYNFRGKEYPHIAAALIDNASSFVHPCLEASLLTVGLGPLVGQSAQKKHKYPLSVLLNMAVNQFARRNDKLDQSLLHRMRDVILSDLQFNDLGRPQIEGKGNIILNGFCPQPKSVFSGPPPVPRDFLDNPKMPVVNLFATSSIFPSMEVQGTSLSTSSLGFDQIAVASVSVSEVEEDPVPQVTVEARGAHRSFSLKPIYANCEIIWDIFNIKLIECNDATGIRTFSVIDQLRKSVIEGPKNNETGIVQHLDMAINLPNDIELVLSREEIHRLLNNKEEDHLKNFSEALKRLTHRFVSSQNEMSYLLEFLPENMIKKLVDYANSTHFHVNDNTLKMIERRLPHQRVESQTVAPTESSAPGVVTSASTASNIIESLLKGKITLLSAAKAGQARIVALLISRGANINVRSEMGATALLLAIEHYHENVIEVLLKHNADMTIPLQTDSVYHDQFHVRAGDTPLHAAAKLGQEDSVSVLLDKGAAIESLSRSKGETPLLSAAKAGQARIVALLISRGANINAHSWEGETALLLAIEHYHENVIEVLLKHNADMTIPMRWGSVYQFHVRAGDTPLHVAAKLGQEDSVSVLLDKGAAIESLSNGMTPLLSAAEAGQASIVALLIFRGANINARSEMGATALRLAIEHCHERVIEVLLKHNADMTIPLLSAAEAGKSFIVARLISMGANINARSEMGATALRLAIEHCHERVIEVLLEHNAHKSGSKPEFIFFKAYPATYQKNEAKPLILRTKCKVD